VGVAFTDIYYDGPEREDAVNLSWYFNAIMLAWLWLYSAWTWPSLPDRVPGHIGFGGGIRWDDATVLAWFVLPIIAAASTAAIWLAARYALRNPRRINIPGKDKLLALPAESQRRVLERVRAALGVIALQTTFILLLSQRMRYQAALGENVTASLVMILAFAVLSGPIIMVTLMVTAQRALDAEARAANRDPAGN